MFRVGKRRGVKIRIRINGPDAVGKITSRMVTIADANVDEVTEIIVKAVDEQAIKDAVARSREVIGA